MKRLKTENTKIEEDKPIYNYVFNPSNSLGKKVLDVLPTLYTTDAHFLKENQQLLESFSNKNVTNIEDNHKINDYAIEETVTAWNEIKSETGFCEKYLFIDWDFHHSTANCSNN